MNRKPANKLIVGFLLLLSISAWGLTSDNDKLLHITSNQAMVDFNNGTVAYQGSVVADQGTRHLTADKLVLNKAPKDGVQNVIAYGNPAKTQYLPAPGSTLAHGQAQIITYIFPSHIFKFQDHAKLDQNNNIFTGPLIIYNTSTKVVHSPVNSLEPTTIILPPYDQEKLPHD